MIFGRGFTPYKLSPKSSQSEVGVFSVSTIPVNCFVVVGVEVVIVEEMEVVSKIVVSIVVVILVVGISTLSITSPVYSGRSGGRRRAIRINTKPIATGVSIFLVENNEYPPKRINVNSDLNFTESDRFLFY